MTDKEMVLNAIRWLPDNVTITEISQELKFLALMRSGAERAEHGDKSRPRGAYRVLLNSGADRIPWR
jgi:hypothetical protein